uniref:Thiosulfate reductase cytochrome B subunit n=1 Tax=Escherichia coli TaxID=562 RepID=A0A1L5JRI1_ECOLX|nr:Thiosulfate reductase cytochrome B subunit [Escherichia coli]AWF76774.1 Thiosulfate reductase cytochrome B subunit [Escherichia coli]AXF37823.1 Thiosulfate reductase cytochrome B subunit [Escherichia coli]
MAASPYLCTLGDTPGQIFRSMVDGYHRHCTAPRGDKPTV